MVVVGAGPAGLAAAWQAATAGTSVKLVAAGWGSLYWHAGCIDVLGYWPLGAAEPLASPREGLQRLLTEAPDHPYALVGIPGVEEALARVAELCTAAGYPLEGSLDVNWLLPTAVGGARPTCLAPSTMTAGDLRRRHPVLAVGIEGFPDLQPEMVAANLEARGIPARPLMVELPPVRERRFVTGPILARMLEEPELRAELARRIRPRLGSASRVGLPAVLGLEHPAEVVDHLQRLLEAEVFEVPTLPPSVPGMRLHRILSRATHAAGGRVFNGMEATAARRHPHDPTRVEAVMTEAAARSLPHAADGFVLATGGILGGGLQAHPDGRLQEVVFDLPVQAPPEGRRAWFHSDFLHPSGHPIHRAGVRVDHQGRPLDGAGEPAAGNVWVAGGALAGADPVRERSLEGMALATGLMAGREAAAAVRGS